MHRVALWTGQWVQDWLVAPLGSGELVTWSLYPRSQRAGRTVLPASFPNAVIPRKDSAAENDHTQKAGGHVCDFQCQGTSSIRERLALSFPFPMQTFNYE